MMTAHLGSGTAGLLVPQMCTSPSLALFACPYITFISLGVLRSCCFLPESVGVGSSGALMGMLSSWVVWIIFRWYVGVFSSVCDLRAAFHCRFMPVMTTLCRGQLVRNPELTHSVFARRKKIPHQCKQQRNCQLFIVLASIVITLATSFTPNVDWAAHAGGALQVTDPVREVFSVCTVLVVSWARLS
jgi:membrane associated rhomboid family serine protease